MSTLKTLVNLRQSLNDGVTHTKLSGKNEEKLKAIYCLK